MEDFLLSDTASPYLFGALKLLRVLFKLYFPQENMRILKVRNILFIWQSAWNRESIQLVNEEWIAENRQDHFRYRYNAIFLIFNQQRAPSESKPHKRHPERQKEDHGRRMSPEWHGAVRRRPWGVCGAFVPAHTTFASRSLPECSANMKEQQGFGDASWQVLLLTR